ncbi:Uncharacterized protein M6B38_241680 [Iris pallida]|uniref:Uncharacterized protein n=1 Tax=Iris pallida TaxID=29817 RepID=A0AAX6DJ68_IRIPA|nr:Uncharacterized protein M6B38_241675 [Iris pallida]KAJ6791862.1 Uncharacterized protein M6B38_241680 [Iris pallida]
MRCIFRSCSLLTGDNILGNTEDGDQYYNSYYDRFSSLRRYRSLFRRTLNLEH